MQEPHNMKGKILGYDRNTIIVTGGKQNQTVQSAIAIKNRNLTVLKVAQLSNEHCTCVEVKGSFGRVYLVSMYFQYSHDIDRYIQYAEEITRHLGNEKVIIAADANAKSPLWHSNITDERGEKLEQLIARNNLIVLNEAGNPPTYSAPTGTSNIDVTLASYTAAHLVDSWEVKDSWTSSDHNIICFSLTADTTSPTNPMAPRFRTKHADWKKFQEVLSTEREEIAPGWEDLLSEDVEKAAEVLQTCILNACKKVLKPKTIRHSPVPWWTDSLTELKKLTYQRRKAYQQEKNPEPRNQLQSEYKKVKNKYTSEIRRAKKNGWEKFVSREGNANPWGVVYKLSAQKITPERALATCKSGSAHTTTWEETATMFLKTLVPDDDEDSTVTQRERRAARDTTPNTNDSDDFTSTEIAAAVKQLRNGKAPGLDRIEVEVLKASYEVLEPELNGLFNACLRKGCFPRIWKTGSIRVLLKSPDKDDSVPTSYRPICLLPVIGKALEKLIARRLEPIFCHEELASERQYGFKKGRSTEDAIIQMRTLVANSDKKYALAILFDIAGAFDHVWWPSVLHRLKERGCPKDIYGLITSYLRDRCVKLCGNNEETMKMVTRGCPQGSILGPPFWNLIFDDLLNELENADTEAVAFADDLKVLIFGNSRRELEEKGQAIVTLIQTWCTNEKLKLSESKTEMTLYKGILDPRRPPKIKIGNKQIVYKNTVRYLGIHFDRGLYVRSHVEKLKSRCDSKFNALARIARKDWGLRHKCLSTLYRGIFIPIMTYAAAAWSDKLTKGNTARLMAAQRNALLRVTKAYRTTSTMALPVIAGELPIDLKIQEATLRYKVRKGIPFQIQDRRFPEDINPDTVIEEIKTYLLQQWQQRWETSERGRHTFSMLPDVRNRMSMTWLHVNHYTTQFISGHGDFAQYLHKHSISDNKYCTCGSVESPTHTLINCNTYREERHQLVEKYAELNLTWPPETHQILNPQTYPELKKTAEEILKRKEHLWNRRFRTRMNNR